MDTPFLIFLLGGICSSISSINALHKGSRLTLSPRPCFDAQGKEGICMFRFDCIRQNGIMLTTCREKFLYGTCCLLQSVSEMPSSPTTSLIHHKTEAATNAWVIPPEFTSNPLKDLPNQTHSTHQASSTVNRDTTVLPGTKNSFQTSQNTESIKPTPSPYSALFNRYPSTNLESYGIPNTWKSTQPFQQWATNALFHHDSSQTTRQYLLSSTTPLRQHITSLPTTTKQDKPELVPTESSNATVEDKNEMDSFISYTNFLLQNASLEEFQFVLKQETPSSVSTTVPDFNWSADEFESTTSIPTEVSPNQTYVVSTDVSNFTVWHTYAMTSSPAETTYKINTMDKSTAHVSNKPSTDTLQNTPFRDRITIKPTDLWETYSMTNKESVDEFQDKTPFHTTNTAWFTRSTTSEPSTYDIAAGSSTHSQLFDVMSNHRPSSYLLPKIPSVYDYLGIPDPKSNATIATTVALPTQSDSKPSTLAGTANLTKEQQTETSISFQTSTVLLKPQPIKIIPTDDQPDLVEIVNNLLVDETPATQKPTISIPESTTTLEQSDESLDTLLAILHPESSVNVSNMNDKVITNFVHETASTTIQSVVTPLTILQNDMQETTSTPASIEETFVVPQTVTEVTSEKSTTEETKPQWDYRKNCGVRPLRPQGRVVGGRNGYFGEWPWQVLVKEATWLGLFVKNKCGGVLLNQKFVVTAAHCQPGFLASLLVLLGEYDLTGDFENLKPITKNVRRMIVHRDYNSQTFENDIALLELDSPVKFQPHVVPICLPEPGEDFTGIRGYVSGWGKLTHGGVLPNVLQAVRVPVVSNSECQQMFLDAGHVKAIRDTFICAGYRQGGRDSCEGDSGGPLTIQRKNLRWVLAGTVSHGIGCADANLPGVYMRTTAYLKWIKSIIN